jgi:hypothetical protein
MELRHFPRVCLLAEQEMRTMRCACCGRSVEQNSAWKGDGHRFYCSEFCADSETPAAVAETPTLIQLHRDRPYQRLERLLPYMRAYSERALAARVSP